jgi:ABC-type glutathione transport system ATPase component
VVLHVTSETADKEEIPGTKTVEDTIAEKLPRMFSAAQRREKVIAMLKAANFQMYNQATGEPVGSPAAYVQDKLRFGTLSGGQRHLIYVLRNFASNPDVIVGDELLGGLDAFRQPRVLHMLRRMKEEAGTAILYIGTELHQLRLVSDSLGFMSEGKICEFGPAEEVMEFPKHPETKEYVNVFKGLPGGRVLGGKLAESYTALAGDPDLAGPWLPIC